VRPVTSSGGWRGARRIEARLWTGPAGHLVGGAADLAEALARYALARARRRLRHGRLRTSSAASERASPAAHAVESHCAPALDGAAADGPEPQ
jgi:hypothetical protein